MAKRATGADGATTVRGKRANGAGSVYFDQANECYFATWRDSAGMRRKVRGKTQADAERRRAVAIEEHDAATRARDSRFTPATTVHELGVWWLANVAPHRMRPSSVGTVGKRLTSERLGVLADLAITALTSEQVQEWQSGLLRGKRALSPSTVADTRVTLNQVLDCAVDHRLIEINPARRVKPPRVPKSNGRHLDASDAQRLVAACSGLRYGVVVAMLFMQGWRVLGIDTTGLGTHVGRRTVVTAMSEDGVPLDDIARHVGHRSTTSTAGYVRSHKERDRATAKRAASLLWATRQVVGSTSSASSSVAANRSTSSR